MKDLRALANLVARVQNQSSMFYKNKPNEVTQASVSAIFRLAPGVKFSKLCRYPQITPCTPYPYMDFATYLNGISTINSGLQTPLVELFFMKRAVCDKDRHSGEIAFPGGKLEADENDYEGCVRECQEEIGIDLSNTDKFAYLGKVPSNFFAYYRKNMKTMMSVNLFFAKDSAEPFTLSPSEVSYGVWTPLDYLLNPQRENICTRTYNVPPMIYVKKNDQTWDCRIWNKIFEGFKDMDLPGLKLPTGDTLFGLTYAATIYMMNLMVRGEESVSPVARDMIEDLRKIKVHYDGDRLGVKSLMTEKIYYYQETKQFMMSM